MKHSRNPLSSRDGIVTMVEQGCKGESGSSIGGMGRANVLMPGFIPGDAIKVIVIVIFEGRLQVLYSPSLCLLFV